MRRLREGVLAAPRRLTRARLRSPERRAEASMRTVPLRHARHAHWRPVSVNHAPGCAFADRAPSGQSGNPCRGRKESPEPFRRRPSSMGTWGLDEQQETPVPRPAMSDRDP
jgi:hypothetical protein